MSKYTCRDDNRRNSRALTAQYEYVMNSVNRDPYVTPLALHVPGEIPKNEGQNVNGVRVAFSQLVTPLHTRDINKDVSVKEIEIDRFDAPFVDYNAYKRASFPANTRLEHKSKI